MSWPLGGFRNRKWQRSSEVKPSYGHPSMAFSNAGNENETLFRNLLPTRECAAIFRDDSGGDVWEES
jgi:hypothetical protein